MSDLLPNDGSFYVSPVDQDDKLQSDQERAETMQVLPFLQELIDWFDKQADECDRVSVLNLESKVPVDSQIQAYKLLAELLQTKKGELDTYMTSYTKR